MIECISYRYLDMCAGNKTIVPCLLMILRLVYHHHHGHVFVLSEVPRSKVNTGILLSIAVESKSRDGRSAKKGRDIGAMIYQVGTAAEILPQLPRKTRRIGPD